MQNLSNGSEVAPLTMLRYIYDNLNDSHKELTKNYWISKFQKSERSFYRRLDYPQTIDYVELSKCWGVPVSELLSLLQITEPNAKQRHAKMTRTLSLTVTALNSPVQLDLISELQTMTGQ